MKLLDNTSIGPGVLRAAERNGTGKAPHRLKIAQVSPLYESVPPELYGGTERVVSSLTEELVRQGHDVTLFASGDSQTAAKLIPCAPRSLRLDSKCIDTFAHHTLMLEEVFSRARAFDVVHFHIDYLHFPLSRRARIPQLTTLHGRLDLPDLEPVYRKFGDMPVVSISNSQRRPLPYANWLRTVYHGLAPGQLSFHPDRGSYLAFLGRISPEKRVDRAIQIARRLGMPLKIAAKVDKADVDYYQSEIKPLLNDPLIEFVGEIGEKEKDRFLGEAAALLFPIDWPEPFGLVMIEAMACGTPVVAFRCGSVPEVIRPGISGSSSTTWTAPWRRPGARWLSIAARAATTSRRGSPPSAWRGTTLPPTPSSCARRASRRRPRPWPRPTPPRATSTRWSTLSRRSLDLQAGSDARSGEASRDEARRDRRPGGGDRKLQHSRDVVAR